MKKVKITSIIIAAAVAAGGVTGVTAAVRYTTGNQTVTVVPASELDYGWGEDSGYMNGYVSSDASQSVFLSGDETVSKVLVKEGDHVKKGDVLLTYDMRKTNLNLESEKISLEETRLQIRVAEENIKILKNKKPVLEPEETPGEPGAEEEPGTAEEQGEEDDPGVIEEPETPEEPGGTEEPETPEEPDGTEDPESQEKPQPTQSPKEQETPNQTDYGEIILNQKLDGDASYFYNHTSGAEPGTEANPYRFLAKDGAKADVSFLKMIQSLDAAENGEKYFEIEIRKGDIPTGILLRAWMQNGKDLNPDQAAEDWSTTLDADQKTSFIIPGTEGSPDQKEDQKFDGNTDAGNGKSDNSADSENKTPETDKNSDGGENISNRGTEGNTDSQSSTEDKSDSSGSIEGTVKKQVLSGETASGISSVRTSGAGEDHSSESSTGSSSSEDSGQNASEDESSTGGESGLISADTNYTEEELKQAKKEQSEQLASLKLDEREGVLKVYLAEKALNDGSVSAITDGIVKKVSDPKNPPTDGSAFLQIAGSEGLSIHGGISERKLDQIHIGDSIQVTSWEDGESYSAKITSISSYPDTSGNFNDGSYATSYYPFTAILDDPDANLEPQSWVDITMNTGEDQEADENSDGTDISGMEDVYSDSSVRADSEAESVYSGSSAGADFEAESVYSDSDTGTDSGTEDVYGGSSLETDSGSEDLSEEVTAESASGSGTDESLSLFKAFVRTDDGDPYVYARGENGRLEKRTVRILKKSSYALTVQGVSEDDYLAFPYGKQVREGARTKEGSIDELYS